MYRSSAIRMALAAEKPKEKPENIEVEPRPVKSKGKSRDKTKLHTKDRKHTAKSCSLQAGSFRDAKKAEQLKQQLDEKGYKAYIMTYSPARGKTFSRVRLGSFESKEDAETVIQELKDMGLEGIIVRGQR